ncbi:hypothetical protein IQ06DRAFT_68900 [Phaeosphaeriaceae sp. SRC1lsM3a]|nr:hypothetical protein IQ06DRAFT_68900 [Stagonospora sp. SRC1lsM3a]
MPRPCQRRRESAAAQRKSKPSNPKPSGPPPIRHKARQKAIHNARRGRGNSRGNGRGGGHGGQPSRNQRSDNGFVGNEDFISFGSGGNNFQVLNRAGSRGNPIALDEDDILEDGELMDSDFDSNSDSDVDDSDDADFHNAGALTINVEVDQGRRGKAQRPVVMFPMVRALAIYKSLSGSGFPLLHTTRARYGMPEVDAEPEVETVQIVDLMPKVILDVPQYSRVSFKSDTVVGAETASPNSSYISPSSSAMSRQQSASTATSGVSNAARDYVFDWGAHAGKRFDEVPENYLRTIAGTPFVLDKHPGVKEAFDFHRPNMRRKVPTERQQATQNGAPVQAPSRGRHQGTRGKASKSWTTYTFPTGAHANKKLNEVPENYLKTIEGMAHVINKWAGLKEALLDYNARTGRQSKLKP